MFMLIKEHNIGYVMLGLVDNTSSRWCRYKDDAFKYHDRDNMNSWGDIRNKSLVQKMQYIKDRYEVIDYYRRADNKFVCIEVDNLLEDYPEYFL